VSTDLPLAAGQGDVDETAGVSEPLLGAALGGLLLLLGLNLSRVSASVPTCDRSSLLGTAPSMPRDYVESFGMVVDMRELRGCRLTLAAIH